MTSIPPIQEMPPVGGYASILTDRVKTKRWWNGRKALAGLLFLHVPGMLYYHWVVRPGRHMRDLEKRSRSCVVQPFLKAERDRAKLVRVHENRAIEAELMKDVPGWQVGTWYGESMYKTLTPDEWEDPLQIEYFIHSDLKDYMAWENEKDSFIFCR